MADTNGTNGSKKPLILMVCGGGLGAVLMGVGLDLQKSVSELRGQIAGIMAVQAERLPMIEEHRAMMQAYPAALARLDGRLDVISDRLSRIEANIPPRGG